MSHKTKHYHQLILLLLGIAVTAFAYWPGLNGPFMLDDFKNIPFDSLNSACWLEKLDVVFSNQSGPLARPISILTFLFHAGWQPENGAFPFKLFNLCLHFFCGVLIYGLFARLEKHRGIALGIVLCWLVHPLLVSTVLYAVQRMTILSSVFILLFLHIYIHIRSIIQPRIMQYCFWGLLLALSFVCAVLSKEVGFIAPVLALLIESTYFIDAPSHRRMQCGLAIFIGLIALLAIPLWPQWMALYEIRGWTIAERLVTQIHVLAYYLQLIVFPTGEELSLYHDDFPLIDHVSISTLLILISFTASLVTSFCLRRRYPWLFFGVAWFFICHLIESTIVPLELVFEHRNYLALLGPVSIFINLTSLLGPVLAVSIPILYLAASLDLTFERAEIWSSLERFTEHTLQSKTESFRVHVDAARLLADAGNSETAQEHLSKAQSLVPTNPGPSIHALYFSCIGESEVTDELIEHAVAALRLGQNFSYSLYAFEQLSYQLASTPCAGLNRPHLISLLQLAIDNPYLALRPHQLGAFFYLQAMNYVLAENFTEAKRRLEKSFESDPNNPIPLLEKANIYAYEHNWDALQRTQERLSAFPRWRYPVLFKRLKAIIDSMPAKAAN